MCRETGSRAQAARGSSRVLDITEGDRGNGERLGYVVNIETSRKPPGRVELTYRLEARLGEREDRSIEPEANSRSARTQRFANTGRTTLRAAARLDQPIDRNAGSGRPVRARAERSLATPRPGANRGIVQSASLRRRRGRPNGC